MLEARVTASISPARRRQIQTFVEGFARPSDVRSGLQVGGALLSYVAALGLCAWSLTRGESACAVLLGLGAVGSLVRLLLLQHELAHRSLFSAGAANDYVGAALSLVTWIPHAIWRTAHLHHHRNFGKLDGPATGYLWTLSTHQYAALHPRKQLAYRLYRHPLVALAFGAPFYFLLLHRLPSLASASSAADRRSVWSVNLALLVVHGGLVLCFGASPLLWLEVAILYLAGSIVIWLFWVQHSHERGYWRASADWDFMEACLRGSSCVRLPRWAEWWTLHVTLHHAHHLAPRVPNYYLAALSAALPELNQVPSLTLGACLRAPLNALWAPERQAMIAFSELLATRAQTSSAEEPA
jgi:acyl-lipid omega-6 desaturase (Delta-12 desaturase)